MYVPVGHVRHAEIDVDAVLGLYVPALQLRQLGWPVLGWYVPVGQPVHDPPASL